MSTWGSVNGNWYRCQLWAVAICIHKRRGHERCRGHERHLCLSARQDAQLSAYGEATLGKMALAPSVEC